MSTLSRKRAAEARRRTQRKFGIVIGAVVTVAAVAALALSHGAGSTPTTPQTHAVTVTGNALSPFDSVAADPAVGAQIPTLSGTSLTDQPVSITNDGKPKVLLFVAHWCPHCQREVPLLATDLRAHPLPANVEMFSISTGVNADAPNYPPSKWLSGVQWPTTVIADDAQSTAAHAFGLTSYPYFVFVDAHNKVVARSSGEMSLQDFHSHVVALT